MYKKKKIAIVVPAYNEEKLITKALTAIPDFVDLIVTIDDGSIDHTAEIIEKCRADDRRIIAITHNRNLGLGISIWDGYAKCNELRADIFVVMAGDAQMDSSDLPGLLDPIVKGKAEYSKGNRLQGNDVRKYMPAYRFFGNAILTFLTKFATGYWHTIDPQCGYTAIKRSAFQKLNKEKLHKGYGYNADILFRLNIADCRVAEIPVKAVYGEANSGIKLRNYIPKVSWMLLRLFLSRLRKKYIWTLHPLLIYYFFGFFLFSLGSLMGAVFLAIDLFHLGGVGFGWMLWGGIMIISGLQLLIFAIWLDMEDNKIFNANLPKFD